MRRQLRQCHRTEALGLADRARAGGRSTEILLPSRPWSACGTLPGWRPSWTRPTKRSRTCCASCDAAVDGRRLRMGPALPRAFLEAAAPGYLTDTDWALLPDDWLEQALDYTAKPSKGIRGPLALIRPRPGPQVPAGLGSGTAWQLADYLDQHGRHARHELIAPPEFWAAAGTYADPADLGSLGEAAANRGLYRDAGRLYKQAGTHGDPTTATYLVALLHDLHPGEQRSADWAVANASLDNPAAVALLLNMLREAGAARPGQHPGQPRRRQRQPATTSAGTGRRRSRRPGDGPPRAAPHAPGQPVGDRPAPGHDPASVTWRAGAGSIVFVVGVYGHRVVIEDVSHQLRAQLAALGLRLDLLAQESGQDAADFAGALGDVARLSRLVDGLLAVARARTPRRWWCPCWPTRSSASASRHGPRSLLNRESPAASWSRFWIT